MVSPVKLWREQKQLGALMGTSGTIVTWSMIRIPPGTVSIAEPYAVALVQLDGEQKRVMCQVVDAKEAELAIGAPVTLVVRRFVEEKHDGVIPYVIKARLKAR